jgi:hypothetical protein
MLFPILRILLYLGCFVGIRSDDETEECFECSIALDQAPTSTDVTEQDLLSIHDAAYVSACMVLEGYTVPAGCLWVEETVLKLDAIGNSLT